MLSSPRKPVSTMRIFSSAENCRRVARRISFTTCSAGSFTDPDFCPICAPSMATMGQKSSLPQLTRSVSVVLMPDMLDKRGAALHPVAVVAIKHAAEVADFGVMDMAAHHSVEVTAAGRIGQRLGIGANILHGIFDLQFQKGRKRPVFIAEQAPQLVEVMVDPQGQRVGAVTEQGQPSGVPD